MLTVAAIALTMMVAAVIIGTFEGGEVTIGGVATSTVTYSLDNINFYDTLEPTDNSTSWYTRLEISAGDYSGPVIITWQLEQKTGPSTWEAITGANTTTTVTLTGAAQDVYASSDGNSTNNYDWSANVPSAGTYHVVATVESA